VTKQIKMVSFFFFERAKMNIINNSTKSAKRIQGRQGPQRIHTKTKPALINTSAYTTNQIKMVSFEDLLYDL
jgi:hypothetical protein